MGQSEQCDSQDKVNHHFIAFIINEQGQLVELDGLKQGPHIVLEKSEDVLKDTAKELIRRLEAE